VDTVNSADFFSLDGKLAHIASIVCFESLRTESCLGSPRFVIGMVINCLERYIERYCQAKIEYGEKGEAPSFKM